LEIPSNDGNLYNYTILQCNNLEFFFKMPFKAVGLLFYFGQVEMQFCLFGHIFKNYYLSDQHPAKKFFELCQFNLELQGEKSVL